MQAHSNEEYYAPKDIYIARKLPLCSGAANTFMRKLDQVIRNSNKDNGGTNQQRCFRIKNPPNTMFTKAPKGLPLDFYGKVWKGYNLDFLSIFGCESENDDEDKEDDSDYGESIELEIDNEDDITTRKKGGKGKEQEIEVNDNIKIELKDEDMEIDTTHNSNFIRGLTEADRNAWQ
ncbi:hypothetical protein O181_132500 [Austropuccinia psidii MF-1]|uniref:Uncharacterized protein n=1 Tax=Austropuccinia psidii MF-1 TaxID=1389203 RepID=A0A9Q3L2Y0_9BASI|nr:hypothetical protein [Austropuccinia psidii MF-1]